MILFIILYEIWPLPFRVFSKRVILPASEKTVLMSRIIASPFVLIGRLNSLEKRNASLENENNSLKAQIAQNEESAGVCLRLSDEQKLSQVSGKETVFANVIGRTPQNYNQKIMIDRGKDDGLSEGAAVMSHGFLVGRLGNVDKNQSTVLPITDHSSLIPAVLEKSRETGLIQGGLEGLVLTDVPINSKIENSEKILTSGLGGDFPSGIIVGHAGVSHKVSGLFQTIEVNYPIRISRIEVVTVIK